MILNKKYSKEFQKIMLEKNIYAVYLSRYPYDLERKYSSSTWIDNSLYDYKLEPDLRKILKLDSEEIRCSNNSLRRSTPLLVKTGESLDYVRELFTDTMIPVVYYECTEKPVAKGFFSDVRFYDDYIDIKRKVRTSIVNEQEAQFPCYIKAVQYHSFHFNSIIIKFYDTGFSNFEESHNICNLPEEQFLEIIDKYKNVNNLITSAGIEAFRQRLLNCFEFLELEKEHFNSLRIEKGQEKQEVQKKKQLIIEKYLK